MKKRYVFYFILTIAIILFCSSTKVSATSYPTVTADNAILIENSTSKVLYDKNANARTEPASVTKIMTAILTIENCNLNDTVKVPAAAVSNIPEGYSIAELVPDEQLTVDQLLQLLMVYSANDAANVLAFHIDGSISAFANRMNAKLQELNLKDTRFTNPSGMHDENHYSTAHDIALLMQYCVKNVTFRKYTCLTSCTIPATNLHAERTFKNTNPMLNSESEYYYKDLVSTKTGFTTPAKYCLASYAKRDDFSMICVLLHSEVSVNRFSETAQLFEYGFNSFAFQDIAKKGDIVTQIKITNATDDTKTLDVTLNEDLHVLAQSDLKDVEPQITLQRIPTAPIQKGELLGSATYMIDDETYSIDLIAANDVVKQSFLLYFMIAALAFVIIVLLMIFILGRKREKN